MPRRSVPTHRIRGVEVGFDGLVRVAVIGPAFMPGLLSDRPVYGPFPRSGISPGVYAGLEWANDNEMRPVYGPSRCGGLSRRWITRRSRVVLRDPLQPIMYLLLRVMIALVANVLGKPLDILGAETDYSVADLPLQRFLTLSNILIHVVRRSAF